MSYIVVYELEGKNSNKQFKGRAWNTLVEKNTLDEAVHCFTGLGDIHPEYCLIAVFKVCGRDTFTKKPYRLLDRRDKSKWLITGLGGLVNSLESDWM